MKYQTASFTNGMFIVTCPHCGGPVELDEGQLEQINAQLSGCLLYTSPSPRD